MSPSLRALTRVGGAVFLLVTVAGAGRLPAITHPAQDAEPSAGKWSRLVILGNVSDLSRRGIITQHGLFEKAVRSCRFDHVKLAGD